MKYFAWMSRRSVCPGRMFWLLLMSETAMMATGPSDGAENLIPDIGNIPPSRESLTF